MGAELRRADPEKRGEPTSRFDSSLVERPPIRTRPDSQPAMKPGCKFGPAAHRMREHGQRKKEIGEKGNDEWEKENQRREERRRERMVEAEKEGLCQKNVQIGFDHLKTDRTFALALPHNWKDGESNRSDRAERLRATGRVREFVRDSRPAFSPTGTNGRPNEWRGADADFEGRLSSGHAVFSPRLS
ncbi:unnamed protein product [Bursaphelenchus xylophilus]|uniref:(pine wood nematode) hypothetical protein n=1 Tax=Bursaphelenchus xylophilus TaxID=6326 RepID=A0A1I7SWZ6_BURXY|nr:unnamed protein product [Bursaphelenchus xylophilus]CAG9100072.1 unnamed protein product [Bursaphelenchus xylophilus]